MTTLKVKEKQQENKNKSNQSKKQSLREKLGPAPLSEIEERKLQNISNETTNQDHIIDNYFEESSDIDWLIPENEEYMRTHTDWKHDRQFNRVFFNLGALVLCGHSLSIRDANTHSVIIENKNDIVNDNSIESKCRDNIDNAKIKSEMSTVFRTFEYNEFEQAKQALNSRQQIKYKLPKHLTTQKLLQMASSLGIDTVKLRKTLTSPMKIKQILDDYVAVHKKRKRYMNIVTEVDYLKFVTEVIPLKCDKYMNPQVQIRMDLDYYTYAIADLGSKEKFIDQLATNVFRCPVNNISISNVHKGSVIVVLAIGLITLAHIGTIALTAHFGTERTNVPETDAKRRINRANKKYANNQRNVYREFELNQKVKLYGKYMATVVGTEIVGEKLEVKIRYDGAKPHYFDLCNKKVFESDDYRIQPLNSNVSGVVHICPAGGCIFATSDSFKNMDPLVGK